MTAVRLEPLPSDPSLMYNSNYYMDNWYKIGA